MESTLHIKNMVCPRCIKVVSEELHTLGFDVQHIELGKVELKSVPTTTDLREIKTSLEKNGFELLDDKKSKVIEKVKLLIMESIREGKFSEMNINLSQYLGDQVQMDYSALSTLFSSVEGKSIERYAILQKIERIKELISYGELSMKEIAHYLGYSSLQALSNQFKKETGLTPTTFKALSEGSKRKSITEV